MIHPTGNKINFYIQTKNFEPDFQNFPGEKKVPLKMWPEVSSDLQFVN
jgi:hypothetical protein